MTQFQRYIGIDYSGAGAPDAPLKTLCVYRATAGDEEPASVAPPGAPRGWSRRAAAEWLAAELADGVATVVGIDHGFSFPKAYFQQHGLGGTWRDFLQDFAHHWPTHEHGAEVIRRGEAGQGHLRSGSANWRRLAEVRTRAKSVFHFDVQGSVAKSTHCGLPWLLYLQQKVSTVYFWPFDGWAPPPGATVVAEAYPALYSAQYPRGERTADEHDAYAIARWLQERDAEGTLGSYLAPNLTAEERSTAAVEGWILGAT